MFLELDSQLHGKCVLYDKHNYIWMYLFFQFISNNIIFTYPGLYICVLQLQNQDSVQVLLRQTESDLGMCLIEASRTQEDPLQRQRLLVEEERLRYLNEEELIIQQLQWAKALTPLNENTCWKTVPHSICVECDVFPCVSSDLERSVEEMRTGAGLNHHLVTEQEIEQKSLELRRLGETVTVLKSEWMINLHTV